MVSFEQGETLKYRSTRIFEVKKRTDQFLILQSLDGLTQVLMEEKNIFAFSEKTLKADSRALERLKNPCLDGGTALHHDDWGRLLQNNSGWKAGPQPFWNTKLFLLGKVDKPIPK